MDQLINVLMVAAIGALILIMCDYMHAMKKWTYKRIAAIMSPVLITWAIMLYLVITTH